MAEFNSINVQEVAPNQAATLTSDTVKSKCVFHRAGSGLICLANSGNECCPARYNVFVKANISVPTGGTAGPISLALSLNGEVLQTSISTVTPAAVTDQFNVSFGEVISAGKCSTNISVVNPNTQAINVQNLTVIVERIC